MQRRVPRPPVRLRSARTVLAAIAMAGATMLVLSGCAPGSSPGAEVGSGSGSAVTTTGTGHGGTLTIGMTASNLPSTDTLLSAAQGNEGLRFVGLQIFDGLTRPNLDQSTRIPTPQPDLATSWSSNADATEWTFTLRKGVSFTDGTPFNADAVVFNLKRYTDPSFRWTTPALVGSAATYFASVKSFEKIDDSTISLTMAAPDAALPEDMQNLLVASPTAVKKYGTTGFASHPIGTGPFAFTSATSGEMHLAANEDYWKGSPRLDGVVLKPMSDPAQRTAALRSGSVDWIEAPNPDDIAGLSDDGYQIVTNSYDHIWPWVFNTRSGPLADKRVRQALNFAIDREGMAGTLLRGTGEPAHQIVPRANSAYDESNDQYDYDPAKAKRLLAAAGYKDGFDLVLQYPTSGSGNMVPTPMNEELQADLVKVGVKVELRSVEWAALLSQFISGRFANGVDAVNISLTFTQESIWNSLFGTGSPLNAGGYSNPKVDALLTQAQSVVDRKQRYALLEQASAFITDDAPWLYVVNDRDPRALASDVRNFVEPQSWFVDLDDVYVAG